MIKLAIVGSMLGCHPGHNPVMGEVLANLLGRVGYPVVLTSRRRPRLVRLADMAVTLMMQRDQIDLQILQVYGLLSFIGEDIASWLGRQLGQKIIMHVHGGAIPEFMAHYPSWGRRVLSRADVIVVPSPFLARVLAAHGFRAQIIPNVIELSLYPYRCRRHLAPRLFWMRTFHPIYNPEMAIRVLARVRKIVPEVTLVIAGQDKGIQAEIQRLTHELGLDKAVCFPGRLDMAAKLQEGNAADIFLNTTHEDNMPVSILEACAMGLPVVATNVGGIPDLLTDGETGLLVPEDDAAMAEAVLQLLSNPDLAGRLSTNGRKLAESSSWERVRPQWERLFADVTGQLAHPVAE